MVLFFDLNIPYLEDAGGSSLESKARKDARLETLVRAMELGYVGVISDSLRCNIDPFPLDSLLKVAPSLFSSAAFTVIYSEPPLLHHPPVHALDRLGRRGCSRRIPQCQRAA